jgi:ribosomal protection tetracycline resistance protein
MNIIKTINLGIVAHVDAGKTTVTENLLYHGKVIDKVGRVDNGDTQTDTMELEKARGITIKASAISFNYNNVKINILDTPGHVDFISEVERSLSVLDGAVLVISAVEGIQSQTKILFNTLKNLNIPTIIFINKLDRLGANYIKVYGEIVKLLSNKAVMMQTCTNEATKEVKVIDNFDGESTYNKLLDALSELDEEILNEYLEKEYVDKELISKKVSIYSKKALIYPIFMGSAVLNIGTDLLLDKIISNLPQNNENSNNNADELSGLVFKIERTASNEKKAYVRMFAGEINVRDIISINSPLSSCEDRLEKVKKISCLENGKILDAKKISSGDIGIIHGISCMKIGSVVGKKSDKLRYISLANPTLKTKISLVEGEDNHNLYMALLNLSDEDPLLDLETDDSNKDIYINLFGEVQKEIISSVLESQYNLKVEFSNTQTMYKETVCGEATAYMYMYQKPNIFAATVKINVEPLERGAGIVYESEVTAGFLLKTFLRAVEEAVYDTCKFGLYGWELTDIKITLIDAEYDSVNSTPADFRNLTPMVLMEAVNNAKTKLLEPISEFELIVPESAISKAMFDLRMMGAEFSSPSLVGEEYVLNGLIPIENSKDYQIKVISYTRGKGLFTTKFKGYRDTEFDEHKICKRNIISPLNKKEYIMYKLNAIKN